MIVNTLRNYEQWHFELTDLELSSSEKKIAKKKIYPNIQNDN
jgi:hypothetical protein